MPKREIRRIRVEGNLAFIPLTKGYEAVIDAADLPLVESFNWCAAERPHTVYAMRKDRSGAKARTVYLHRQIMAEPEGVEVDHRDGNGLNNRRRGPMGNLRAASHVENAFNQRASSLNTSGLKGVGWFAKTSKWRAQIIKDGKRMHLGYFATAEEAHAAYCKASADLHGEFGRAG